MIPLKYLDIDLKLPKPPSLNAYFNSKHWAVKVKYKKEYTKYCEEQIELYDKFTCETYEIHIRYNSRHDVDNVILVSKFLSDTLVDKGVVKDDGNKYYKRLNIEIDKSLPKDTFFVKVKCKGVKNVEDE